MTEQQALALVARLERVWQPERVRYYKRHYDGVVWHAVIQHSIFLGIVFYRYDNYGPTSDLYYYRGKKFVAGIGLNDEGRTEETRRPTKNLVVREFAERFVTHWTPIFRRNCWLCGASIESSAHEKLEWMQGFSAEEVDSWNLMF